MDTISDLVLAGVDSTTFTLKDKGTETGVTSGLLIATATDLSGVASLTAALNLLAAGAGNTNGVVTWGGVWWQYLFSWSDICRWN